MISPLDLFAAAAAQPAAAVRVDADTFAILTAAAQPAAAVNVDADTFAKLCERPDAQLFTLDDLDGLVTFDGCVTADGVAYRVNVATAAFERSLFAAAAAAAAAQPRAQTGAVYVDEANFAKLCEHPDAQRCILNGVLCVDLDGVTYRHADSLPGPDDDESGVL